MLDLTGSLKNNLSCKISVCSLGRVDPSLSKSFLSHLQHNYSTMSVKTLKSKEMPTASAPA